MRRAKAVARPQMRARTNVPVAPSDARPQREVLLRRELHGPLLIGARAVVGAYAVLAVFVYVYWLPGWIAHEAGLARHAAQAGGAYPYVELGYAAVGATILAAFAWFALGTLVFLRRSRDLFGLVLVLGFLSFGFVMGTFDDTGSVIALSQPHWWAPPWPAFVLVAANALSLPWAFTFPDGRFIPPWTVALGGAWMLLWIAVGIAGPLSGQAEPAPALIAVLVPTLVASPVGSLAYRFWHGSSAVERQQLKWILLGTLIFVVLYLLTVPSGALLLPQNPTATQVFFQTLHSATLSLAVIVIPVAIGIAIFRQGLLDIDLIINRTLAYGSLTAVLALAFLLISRASNALLIAMTGQRSDFVLLASVLPVALAFMPARAQVIKIADRFVAEHRVMTLFFIDIVGSTDRAYALGDRSWRELLERFRATARHSIKRCRGKEIDTTGDGFFVTFEAPEQAIRCGHQLIAAVRTLGLEVRVGIHIGEVEVDGRHVEGGNVHLAARVTAAAGAGEVLVSGAVRDVLAGSEIHFDERGVHRLKGVPEPVYIYSAAV